MSESSQFRQYADEAMSWAIQSKTEKEKATLFELARTWMRESTTFRQTTIQPGRLPQLAAASHPPLGVGFSHHRQWH
jgi:cation transport regulator ChaC